MNRAAFFDIDGTLVNCITQEVLAKILRREGILNFGRSLQVAMWFLFYKLGLTNNSVNVRKSAYAVFKLCTKEQIDAIFHETQTIIQSHIRWPMKRIVDGHKHKGDLTVAISASVENLCVSICDTFGIQQHSTVLSLSDGRYDGLWKGELYEGKQKVNLIMQLKEKHQLNLNECSSYADSCSDIPMLEVVGHPVAVCPDRKLRKHATSKKWSILEI